jgi:hypothetical protein
MRLYIGSQIIRSFTKTPIVSKLWPEAVLGTGIQGIKNVALSLGIAVHVGPNTQMNHNSSVWSGHGQFLLRDDAL